MTASTPEDLAHAAELEGVRDQRLLAAIRAIPRADFVPAGHANRAYVDAPVAISHDQVTSQPSLIAQMIEALQLDGTEHVLEIGTGYGFQTALLATLAADVVSIERWDDMIGQARRNLARHRIDNVRLLVGDGSGGAPDRAPFGGILIAAAYPQVPAPLVPQLRLGGRLVQPIGPGGNEQVLLYHRTPNGLDYGKHLTAASFVRLHGNHGYHPGNEW